MEHGDEVSLPSVTFAKHIEVDGSTAKVQRQTEAGADGEEQALGIDSYAPKHRLARHGRDPAQLFEHKLAIALRDRHRLLGFRRAGIRPMPR